ncbi:MAG: succinate dehydrogenase [Hyphomicrobiaceae bacterium]|nr:MAG: succinate dehydrogenase [Hyphomicrobiaceae bacterium]
MTVRRYIVQRLTAALMIPLVLGHLIIIHYATSRGLTAAEILGRTRGSMLALLFYGLFVILAAAHAAVGARTLLAEWTPLRGQLLDIAMWVVGFALAALGARAVAAVVLPW